MKIYPVSKPAKPGVIYRPVPPSTNEQRASRWMPQAITRCWYKPIEEETNFFYSDHDRSAIIHAQL